MAWEWAAPVGTVAGAMITAWFGAYYGGRRTQERQHKFERESSVRARGREKADVAIEALRALQKDNELAAALDAPGRPAENSDVADERVKARKLRDELESLGAAVEYLTDPVVRSEIELVHNVIGDSHIVMLFGEGEQTTAAAMIWVACGEGIAVLGRYLRDEFAQEPSDRMKALRVMYETANARLEEELEAQERRQGS